MKPFMLLTLLPLLLLAATVSASGIPVRSDPDISRRPDYARYDFGTSPRVIDAGIQPMGVPIGVITEVMKRDRILARELREKGYEIRFHPFLKGDDINSFLKQGKIDVAMAGDMPTIMTASSFDIVVCALTKQGFSSVVAKGGVTVADLKGKRIGYPPVSNAHHALLVALASAGLKEGDVRLVPMEVNEMIAALTRGRIDAFTAWEPITSIALKNVREATVIFRHLNSSYLYFSRSFADRHPEAASLIVASVIRAYAWMKKKEEHLRMAGEWSLTAGVQLQGKPLALSPEEIAALTRKDILSITSSPAIPERDLAENGSIRKEFDFLQREGKIATSVRLQRVLGSFDRGTVAGVLANPKRYRLNSFDYEMGKAAR